MHNQVPGLHFFPTNIELITHLFRFSPTYLLGPGGWVGTQPTYILTGLLAGGGASYLSTYLLTYSERCFFWRKSSLFFKQVIRSASHGGPGARGGLRQAGPLPPLFFCPCKSSIFWQPTYLHRQVSYFITGCHLPTYILCFWLQAAWLTYLLRRLPARRVISTYQLEKKCSPALCAETQLNEQIL